MCGLIRFNHVVDVYLIRRERLRQLIDDDFKGNQTAFSEQTKYKAPQINRWLSTRAASLRNITEESAREIERRAGKPEKWLDMRESLGNERRLALVQTESLDDNLKRLIDGYRLADPITQKHMLRMAEDAIENFGKRSGEASL